MPLTLLGYALAFLAAFWMFSALVFACMVVHEGVPEREDWP